MKRPKRVVVPDQETPNCHSVCNKDDDDGGAVDEEEEEEEILREGDGDLGGKKRRLRLDQVKALEKNFEVENKLEPERKVKLAEELGLRPRQVAVWFQNRRARWKTKKLERDYAVLKAEYESLKLDHKALRSNNEDLLSQIKELNTKGGGGGEEEEAGSSVKDATLQLVKNVDVKENNFEGEEEEEGHRSLPAFIHKDGSSDSDGSAILNDDGKGGISSGVMFNLPSHPQQQKCFVGNDDSSSSSPFEFLEDGIGGRGDNYQYCYFQQHQQKVEEERMLAVEENLGYDFLNDGGSSNSNIFSDEQVPALLPWYYCPDDPWKWN